MKMNDKGFSLVEVIAGFMLLVVLLTSFVNIINLSSKLITAATDAKNSSTEFEKSYFNGYNYKADGSKKAFRTDGYVVFDKNTISLVEGSFDETTNEFTAYTVEPYFTDTLKDVQLIKIENLYDKKITRTSVYRYYTEPVVPWGYWI